MTMPRPQQFAKEIVNCFEIISFFVTQIISDENRPTVRNSPMKEYGYVIKQL